MMRAMLRSARGGGEPQPLLRKRTGFPWPLTVLFGLLLVGQCPSPCWAQNVHERGVRVDAAVSTSRTATAGKQVAGTSTAPLAPIGIPSIVTLPQALPSPSALAAPPLSVQDAVRLAVAHHPTIQKMDELRLANRSVESEAAAAMNPHLGLESVVKSGPNSAPGLGFLGLANSSLIDGEGADVVLSQQIFDWGRTLHRVRSAKDQTRAAAYDEEAERRFVALGVYQAYNNVGMARHLLGVATSLVKSRGLVARQAQARFEAGLISRIDVDLARASLADAQVRLEQATNDVTQAYADLNTAMGVDVLTAWDLTSAVADTPPADLPRTVEADVSEAMRERVEILSLQSQVDALKELSLSQSADNKPYVRALASGGYLNVLPRNDAIPHVFAVGLTFNWPFYTGGYVEAQMAETRHRAAAVRHSLDEMKLTVQSQVVRARLTLRTLTRSYAAIHEQVVRSADAFKLATERYRVGLGNLIEVQQADLALLTAVTNETRLQYQVYTGQAALDYARGALMWPAEGVPAVPPASGRSAPAGSSTPGSSAAPSAMSLPAGSSASAPQSKD